jgi:hypothetical protein
MQQANVKVVVQERWSSSTLYHVQVKSQLGHRDLRNKLFSDFEDLHNKLVKRNTHISAGSFPQKKLTVTDKKHRIEAIRRGLEDYFNALLGAPETAGDEVLCAFLEIPPVVALFGFKKLDKMLDAAQNRTPGLLPDELSGIGVTFFQDAKGNCIVADVLSGGPAHASGKIQKNDCITQLDGISVTGLALDQIMSMIKGPAGTPILVQLFTSSGQVMRAQITRAHIRPIQEAQGMAGVNLPVNVPPTPLPAFSKELAQEAAKAEGAQRDQSQDSFRHLLQQQEAEAQREAEALLPKTMPISSSSASAEDEANFQGSPKSVLTLPKGGCPEYVEVHGASPPPGFTPPEGPPGEEQVDTRASYDTRAASDVDTHDDYDKFVDIDTFCEVQALTDGAHCSAAAELPMSGTVIKTKNQEALRSAAPPPALENENKQRLLGTNHFKKIQPEGFEDYSLALFYQNLNIHAPLESPRPLTPNTRSRLAHEFDLDHVISKLPAVASPPQLSPSILKSPHKGSVFQLAVNGF